MLTRIISGLILFPIVVFFVFTGGVPLKLFTLFLSLVGMNEFYKAFEEDRKILCFVGYACSFIYVVFAEFFINENNMFNILVSIYMVILLAVMVLFHNDVGIKDIIIIFFGFFYVSFLISHIYLVREFTYGRYFVWLIFISAFGCDTGAYFSGMLLGRHKLIPSLSPKKTIEGAVGGVIIATLRSILYSRVWTLWLFALSQAFLALFCRKLVIWPLLQ